MLLQEEEAPDEIVIFEVARREFTVVDGRGLVVVIIIKKVVIDDGRADVTIATIKPAAKAAPARAARAAERVQRCVEWSGVFSSFTSTRTSGDCIVSSVCVGCRRCLITKERALFLCSLSWVVPVGADCEQKPLLG